MSPTPLATPLPHLIGGLSAGAVVALQLVDGHDVSGNTITRTVQDVDRQDVVVDGLGRMLRLEGRLYLAATGEAFDLVGLFRAPGVGRRGVRVGVLDLDHLTRLGRSYDLKPMLDLERRDIPTQDPTRDFGHPPASLREVFRLSPGETKNIEGWLDEVEREGGRR